MSKLKQIYFDIFVITFLIVSMISFIVLLVNGVTSKAYAQEGFRTGPPIYCGDPDKMKKGLTEYSEEQVIILVQTTPDKIYLILYRNMNTGSWSIISYNVPNIDPKFSCLMLGGHSSFILPDIKEIEKMLGKQNKGLDNWLSPPTPKNKERES